MEPLESGACEPRYGPAHLHDWRRSGSYPGALQSAAENQCLAKAEVQHDYFNRKKPITPFFSIIYVLLGRYGPAGRFKRAPCDFSNFGPFSYTCLTLLSEYGTNAQGRHSFFQLQAQRPRTKINDSPRGGWNGFR